VDRPFNLDDVEHPVDELLLGGQPDRW
jgi:hypothetical protein